LGLSHSYLLLRTLHQGVKLARTPSRDLAMHRLAPVHGSFGARSTRNSRAPSGVDLNSVGVSTSRKPRLVSSARAASATAALTTRSLRDSCSMWCTTKQYER
jgi:hypothetical protein